MNNFDNAALAARLEAKINRQRGIVANRERSIDRRGLVEAKRELKRLINKRCAVLAREAA